MLFQYLRRKVRRIRPANRPVSVLTALSKLYEKVLFDQIYEAFYWRLSPNLSGFLKGHSCCTALLKLTEDWRACLDRREAVAAVAIDLSKAFDSVCHPLLLAKLKAYGFTHDALEIMTAYLIGRRQRVKLDGVHSTWRTIKTGVPQGSLLGPLLFNMYVNDLNYFITNTSLRLYADDTTQYASDVSPILHFEVQNSPGNELGSHNILGLFWGTQAIRSDKQIMVALSHPSIKLNEDDIPGAKL